jgi:predicted ATP-grasp superfamily ATP-dependent carboligase
MPEEILIVAISGRALAQSAARTGCRVRVLDAFADRDTQALAETVCVGADGAIALDGEKLFAALDALDTQGQRRAIVAGSGFERSPQTLDPLAAYGTLCANDADIVAALKDPELAAELLRALGWQVPETRCEPPADPRGWLQKEIGGAGGVHVRRAHRASAHARAYYQREAPGRALSVTFLADAQQAWVLGFNALAFRTMGDAPFCYAGASTCSVEAALEREVQARLDRLVRVTGLRGLNGLDFLLDGRDVCALEVNPRPTATFELYDPDYAQGLVDWHVRSFAGLLPGFPGQPAEGQRPARACAIVYAEQVVRVPCDAELPSWCRDLPAGGNAIQAGAPVLSVFAEARSEVLVQRLLQQRQQDVQLLLERWQADAPSECPA